VAFYGIFEGDVTADASWSDFETWVADHYDIPTFFGYFAFYHESWAEDPAWTDPGDGNDITAWRSNGSKAEDFGLSATGNAPVFRSSVAALNSRPAIQQTASQKFMLINAGVTPTKAQPNTFVIVINDTTASGSRSYFDGDTTSTSRNLVYNDDTNFGMFAGNVVTMASAESGAMVIVTVFDGTSSVMRVNGAETAAGSTPGTYVLDGFRLGADFNDTTGTFDGHYAYAAYFDGDLTADADFVAWEQKIMTYYGITA